MGKFFVNCAKSRKNTGVSKFCDDLAAIRKFILVPLDFEMTEEDARDWEKWQDLIHATPKDRIYPFPIIHEHTDNTEETVMDEGSLGSIFVRDGKIMWNFTMKSSRYAHEALKSHSLQPYRIIFFDAENRIQGIRSANGNLTGQKLQQFVVGRLMPNNGSDSATKTEISMVFEDSTVWERRPAIVAGLDWSTTDLEGLTDIYITDVVGTTSGVTFMATDKNGNPFNGEKAETGTDIDFVVTDSDGAVQTISAVTSETGENNLTVTLTVGDYFVDLNAPADMVNKGFGSGGKVPFTVSVNL